MEEELQTAASAASEMVTKKQNEMNLFSRLFFHSSERNRLQRERTKRKGDFGFYHAAN